MKTEPRRSGPHVIVALDFASAADALALVAQLQPDRCRVKIGMELFTAAGPGIVAELVERGFDVFLDLKYHDIPNTVAAACTSAARLGVWMLNVHTLGGTRMMQAAREAIDRVAGRRPLLVGVTLLTSHAAEELPQLGLSGQPREHVLRLARQAQASGLDGVVCSAREAGLLRAELGSSFCLVTPGIRLAGAANDDQRRIVTPAEAIRDGADYLVIGRPVTAAREPAQVLAQIHREIGTSVSGTQESHRV